MIYFHFFSNIMTYTTSVEFTMKILIFFHGKKPLKHFNKKVFKKKNRRKSFLGEESGGPEVDEGKEEEDEKQRHRRVLAPQRVHVDVPASV